MEVIDCFNHLAFLFNRQKPPVIAQRMNNNRGVLSRLHDFIQIDDGSMFDAKREGPVHPQCLLSLQQITSHEIGCREILMARHRDERTTQAMGHVLHEPRFAAARRPFEHHRHTALRRNREKSHLAADLGVKRLTRDAVAIDVELLPFEADALAPRSFQYSCVA